MQRSLWDKTWRDRRGRVVLWQTPNAWLIGWAVLTTVSLFINGRPADVLSWLAQASLAVWCGLEIFRGVDYFRRGLGLLILVFVIMSVVRNF